MTKMSLNGQKKKLTMDKMLGKLVKLIVTVPSEYLGTLVDLCEKLTSDEGANYLEKIKLVLRKQNVSWEKVKTIYTRLVTPNLTLSDGSVAEVRQLIEKATFEEIFRGLEGSMTLDDLCVSRDRQEKFLLEHLDQFPRDSWMFFLYKEGDSFLVAIVYRYSTGHLGRGVRPLSSGKVWFADNSVRIMVPQQTI